MSIGDAHKNATSPMEDVRRAYPELTEAWQALAKVALSEPRVHAPLANAAQPLSGLVGPSCALTLNQPAK